MLVVLAALLLAAIDLRLDYVRHSLTATYRHYTQYVDGVPVLGGEVIERDGQEVYRALGVRPSRPLSPGGSPGDDHGRAGCPSGAGETPALHEENND